MLLPPHLRKDNIDNNKAMTGSSEYMSFQIASMNNTLSPPRSASPAPVRPLSQPSPPNSMPNSYISTQPPSRSPGGTFSSSPNKFTVQPPNPGYTDNYGTMPITGAQDPSLPSSDYQQTGKNQDYGQTYPVDENSFADNNQSNSANNSYRLSGTPATANAHSEYGRYFIFLSFSYFQYAHSCFQFFISTIPRYASDFSPFSSFKKCLFNGTR